MYRHFQSWKDKRQVRVTYQSMLNNRRYRISVRVVYTNTARQARILEKALILKYKPKDNPDKLELFNPTPAELKQIEKAEHAYFDCLTDSCPF